ncbi:MAG: hypothetical protein ABIH92_02860 [Nanoarchaeota archaeon]
MREDFPSRLVNYLRGLDAQVNYKPFDFSVPDNPQYAAIEVITTEFVAGDLQAQVNSRLCRENGHRASLRALQISDIGNGRYRYCVEIVPFDDVKGERDCVNATRRFLQGLSHVVKNFRCVGPDGQEKRRRKK